MPETADGQKFIIDRSAFLNNQYSAFLHENITLEDRKAQKFIQHWNANPGVALGRVGGKVVEHVNCKPPWSASGRRPEDRQNFMCSTAQRQYLQTPTLGPSEGYVQIRPSTRNRVNLTKLKNNQVQPMTVVNGIKISLRSGERLKTPQPRAQVLDVQAERRRDLLNLPRKINKKHLRDKVVRNTLLKLKNRCYELTNKK